MSTAISIAFGVGMLAVVSTCGLPFALAALGLRAIAREARPSAGLGSAFLAATAIGAGAGAGFAATFLLAALLAGAGVEISDLAPVAALVLALALIATGVRAMAGAREFALRGPTLRAAALAGIGYALVSLPCALPLLEGLVTQTDKGRGPAAVAGVAILFSAGAVALAIAIALLGALLAAGVRRAGTAGVAVAGSLCFVAGVLAAAYWSPAVVDGVGARGGGGLADALAATSGALGKLLADQQLAVALLLLAASISALAHALGRPRRLGLSGGAGLRESSPAPVRNQ